LILLKLYDKIQSKGENMSESILTLIIFLIFLVIAVVLFFVIKHLEKRRLASRKKIKSDAKPKLKLNALPLQMLANTKHRA